ANIIAPVVFPLMLLAVNSAGLRAETHIPGFPTGSIVAFILAVPFIQGALFATMNTGTDFARDIQTGFLSRLSLTPMRGVVLLPGFPTGPTFPSSLAVAFIQGAPFATINPVTDFTRDIQSGRLSRLSLPRRRGVVLRVGQLGGTITLGLFQAVVYVAVGLVIG